jgi:hypothetical protein
MLSTIEIHGKKVLEEENLTSKRIIGTFPNYTEFSPSVLIEIINQIPHFCINDTTYYLKTRTHTTGFSMNWHIDDANIMNIPKDNMYSELAISDKKMLVYQEHKPLYTLMLYENNHGEDFTGGTLEFIDGTIIEPKKGKYVLFDSREVRRLNEIGSGERKSILINFYN